MFVTLSSVSDGKLEQKLAMKHLLQIAKAFNRKLQDQVKAK